MELSLFDSNQFATMAPPTPLQKDLTFDSNGMWVFMFCEFLVIFLLLNQEFDLFRLVLCVDDSVFRTDFFWYVDHDGSVLFWVSPNVWSSQH